MCLVKEATAAGWEDEAAPTTASEGNEASSEGGSISRSTIGSLAIRMSFLSF